MNEPAPRVVRVTVTTGRSTMSKPISRVRVIAVAFLGGAALGVAIYLMLGF